MANLKDPFFRVVLVEPEIPNNTGNIGRTCVGTATELHLVGKLGFEINDKQLRRAGLDYWKHLSWFRHNSFQDWLDIVPDKSRLHFFTTKTKKSYITADFKKGDWLIFGRETKGLRPEVLEAFSEQLVTIPMYGEIRSLNLSNAVSIALYEGIRHII